MGTDGQVQCLVHPRCYSADPRMKQRAGALTIQINTGSYGSLGAYPCWRHSERRMLFLLRRGVARTRLRLAGTCIGQMEHK